MQRHEGELNGEIKLDLWKVLRETLAIKLEIIVAAADNSLGSHLACHALFETYLQDSCQVLDSSRTSPTSSIKHHHSNVDHAWQSLGRRLLNSLVKLVADLWIAKT